MCREDRVHGWCCWPLPLITELMLGHCNCRCQTVLELELMRSNACVSQPALPPRLKGHHSASLVTVAL